jgi:hypothetical protein
MVELAGDMFVKGAGTKGSQRQACCTKFAAPKHSFAALGKSKQSRRNGW